MDKKETQEDSWQCPTCDVWVSMENKACPSCMTKKPGITEENGESEVFMMDNGTANSPEEIPESPLSPGMAFHESYDVTNNDNGIEKDKIENYSIISYKSRSKNTRLWPVEGYQWMFFVGGLTSLFAGIFLWPSYLFSSISFISGLVLRREGLIKVSWFLIISAMIITALGMPYGTPWGLFLTIIHS